MVMDQIIKQVLHTQLGARGGAAAAEAAVLLMTLLVSLVANVSIALAVLRYREMRTVTNCFLLNLAAADLVFALGIPAVVAARLSASAGWPLGPAACRLLPYSQFVCGFVLLWTLTLISMDRHRCIVVPPYRSRLTPRLATGLTALTWILAAVLFLPVFFWFHEQPVADGSLTVCTLIFPKSDTVNLSLCFTIPVLLLACLLPMGLLVYHYQRIFQKLLTTRSRWAVPCVVVHPECSDTPSTRRDSDLSFVGSLVMPWSRKISTASQVSSAPPSGRSGSLSAHEELRLSKHLRVVRVLLLNVVVVLIMWLPITVVMFLIYVDGSRPNEDTGFFLRSHHFVWALAVALLNTVVNPLLYGVLSENFRACFVKLWFGTRRKKQSLAGLKNGASKSNGLDGAGDGAKGGARTPSSGRANGYPVPGKAHKKFSTCSQGSVLDAPSGNLV
ncbi:RYamide receptor [Gryllus bimaculatus]|nr:RYamide receptor [Gryllus bimaculatus]